MLTIYVAFYLFKNLDVVMHEYRRFPERKRPKSRQQIQESFWRRIKHLHSCAANNKIKDGVFSITISVYEMLNMCASKSSVHTWRVSFQTKELNIISPFCIPVSRVQPFDPELSKKSSLSKNTKLSTNK